MEEMANKKYWWAHVHGNEINLDGALYEIPKTKTFIGLIISDYSKGNLKPVDILH